MDNNKMSKKNRVTLDLSQKAYLRLESLRNVLEIDTKATVIRQALQLYEYLLYEIKTKNKKIFIGDNKKTAKEVILFRWIGK